MSAARDDVRFLFGVDSASYDVAARQSDRVFVRDQDHLALANPASTGRRLTAWEAFQTFGAEKLREAIEYGAAILVPSPDEPARTLASQREALGLTQRDVARVAEVDESAVAAMELGRNRVDIRSIERVAQALALDERLIGFKAGAEADSRLAFRLREYRSGTGRLPKQAVSALSSACWVARTQARLKAQLSVPPARWREFQHSDDFGSFYKSPWRVGYDLAEEARRILRLPLMAPIASIRRLLDEIGVIYVQAPLPPSLAGATVSVHDERAIVVNTQGQNSNPWVRRATVAHELCHLFWDPEEKLNRLRVDDYHSLQVSYSRESDKVEARANAFAIAFLAPPAATRRVYTDTPGTPDEKLRAVMDVFGISLTAARHHVENTFINAGFSVPEGLSTARPDREPSTGWSASENFALDWFPIRETPEMRRGEFAAVVVAAEQLGIISSDTAAGYLSCSTAKLAEKRPALQEVFR